MTASVSSCAPYVAIRSRHTGRRLGRLTAALFRKVRCLSESREPARRRPTECESVSPQPVIDSSNAERALVAAREVDSGT